MKTKSKFVRICCVLLAAIMLVTSAGMPTTTEAATNKYPYYIKINRKQNCVTVYGLDAKGKYTVPVKAMTCSVGVNNATPTGTFSISNQYRWHQLMGGVYGQYCSRIVGGVCSIPYITAPPIRVRLRTIPTIVSEVQHHTDVCV